jgi:hypothetical protein
MLEQLTPDKRHGLIETLVGLLEKRAATSDPTMQLAAQLAIAHEAA